MKRTTPLSCTLKSDKRAITLGRFKSYDVLILQCNVKNNAALVTLVLVRILHPADRQLITTIKMLQDYCHIFNSTLQSRTLSMKKASASLVHKIRVSSIFTAVLAWITVFKCFVNNGQMNIIYQSILVANIATVKWHFSQKNK